MLIKPFLTKAKITSKNKLCVAILLLAGCTSNQTIPVISSTEISQTATSTTTNSDKTAPNNKTKDQSTEIVDMAVSTDYFAVPGLEGTPGNGSGDLVLLVSDEGGSSPRKRSIFIDLALRNSHGELTNDLTVNNVFDLKKRFSLSLADLSAFITASEDPNKIYWQVFGIANHFKPEKEPFTVNLHRHGLLTTEAKGNKRLLNTKQLHLSKAYRASLILNNNTYGIKSNRSLISFSGEASAFNQRLHGTLSNGISTTHALNFCSTLVFYKLYIDNTLGGSALSLATTKKIKLGSVCLSAKGSGQTTLTYKP